MLRITWRSNGKAPSSYDNVELVRELAQEIKDEIVDMDWVLDRKELAALRRAASHWERFVVKQFKRFDYEVVRGITRAIGDPGGLYRGMQCPGGADHRDSGVEVSAGEDVFRFRAHASFSVAFGYARGAYLALHPREGNEADGDCRILLGEALAKKITVAFSHLGWDLGSMAGPEFKPVICELYNLPLDYPFKFEP